MTTVPRGARLADLGRTARRVMSERPELVLVGLLVVLFLATNLYGSGEIPAARSPRLSWPPRRSGSWPPARPW